MFGLSFDKLVFLALIAVVIVGPSRLPGYAARLAKFVKTAREVMDTAKDRMRNEFGPDFDDVDWKKLDPRQYDPRRIIRTALLDDDVVPTLMPIRRVGSRHEQTPDDEAEAESER